MKENEKIRQNAVFFLKCYEIFFNMQSGIVLQRATKVLSQNIKIVFIKIKFNDENRNRRVGRFYLSCKIFNLTLREVESFVRICEMILGYEETIIKWFDMDAYSFFICLFLKRKNIFKHIDKGFSVDNFISFIKSDSLLKIFSDGDKYFYESYLLGTVACSFITVSGREDFLSLTPKSKQSFEKDKKRISDHFPTMRRVDGRPIYPLPGSSDLDYGQSALKICEKISKC